MPAQAETRACPRVTRNVRLTSWSILLCAAAVMLGRFELPAIAHPGLHHDIERLTGALAKEPGRADLWIKRSHHYRLDGKHSRALADLDHARALTPNNLDICMHRGLTLSAMGRDAEAEKELTRFLAGGVGSAAAFAARGRIREHDRRYGLALSDYSSAIALKKDVKYYLLRGRLQESLGRLDEAAAGYRDGLRHLGGAVTIRSPLIQVEIARGRYAAALALIDEGLSRVPVKTEGHLRRAEVFEACGQVERARLERSRALAEANRVLRKRATAIHLFSRAKVHVTLGHLEDAKSDLELALDWSPRFSGARELLGQLEGIDAR